MRDRFAVHTSDHQTDIRTMIIPAHLETEQCRLLIHANKMNFSYLVLFYTIF
jgi:hypothetical protein